ncbi:MAG: zinc-dependent alcohol dehydrogenase family protein [Acidobacteriota bacterium]
MKAVLYEAFGKRPELVDVEDPSPEPHGVVVRVGATGVCRSDWHGWMGHDPDITLPHVPGHELAGTVEAVGRDVTRWRPGDRVTVPFVGGCGDCPECDAGQQQVCRAQFQPGFTHWGSFASHVSLHHADLNLVALPETVDFATAASLGCRFATSFRAVVDQGRVRAGEWVVVHGCGGVGLSAVHIASALGARVLAVDIAEGPLERARELGADLCMNVIDVTSVPEAVHELTEGGAHLSLDALGHPQTCSDSVLCLRRQGRHVQVGLLLGDQSRPPLPMDRVIGWELEILGSHGMQAHRYDVMLAMMTSGRLQPERLLGAEISLEESIEALTAMDRFGLTGTTVITSF